MIKDNLTTNASNEAENPAFLVGAVIGSAFRSALISIGFQELPHFTITNNLIYDLGRNRHLSFGSIETPNEMLFICETEEYNSQKIEGLIVLKNYDYDGYTKIEDVKTIITAITGHVF